MPINLTYEEFFKRVQGVEDPPPPPEPKEEEVIEPDNYIYDEDTFEMVENEKPKDGDFYDAPLSVQGRDRRRTFGDDDEFDLNDLDDEGVHPIIKEHVNEHLIRNEKLSPEEQELVNQHNQQFLSRQEWRDFIDVYKQAPSVDNIPDAIDRPEEIFKNRYNLAIDKTKITEMLIDSYFVYDNEGEPEHNSTTIDNPETDANVEIYHKDGYDVVAFRGTEATHIEDLKTDMNTFGTRLSSYFNFITPENDLMAHSGFVKAVASVYDEVKDNIRNNVYDGTGHSMGSAEIQIFAYVYLQDTGIRPRHLISFGSPRWCIETEGMPTSRYNLALDHLRVMNANDMVTYMPTGDSTLMGMTKFATMGAMSGGAIGQYAGGSGAGLGSLIGTAIGGAVGGMASGGYKHVGVGLLLTSNKNAVLDIEGKQVKLKNKNYYIIPEDLDLARNPINFDSTLLENIAYGGAYSMINNYMTNAITQGTVFSGMIPPNVFEEMRNIYNIQFLEKLESKVVKLFADKRIRDNSLGRPFFESARRDETGRLWATAESYLTGKILEDYQEDTAQLRELKINIRRLYRQQRGEELRPLETFGIMKDAYPDEDLTEYNRLSNQVLLRSLNAQLTADTETARTVYGLIGVQLTSRLLLDAGRLRHNLNHIQGHLFADYFHNVGMLPNIIFDGAKTYQTNEGIKYLGYAKNQFVEYPQVNNHVLGFMFYPANQELLYNNKIIVY